MSKAKIKIKPYVTAKGGVVILNGPFPIPQAKRIAAICAAAPDLLEACKKAINQLSALSGNARLAYQISGEEHHQATIYNINRVVSGLQAALAKAKGAKQ